ncbi:MAG: PilZ domain-containing protein [Sphingobium sp.]|nr:PilZ domain-containing protein [Sphingobium sp.]
MSENNREDRRFRTEIPVFVSTVLDRHEAWIVDVSQQGVQLRGCSAGPRMRVIMEYEGGATNGTVRWAKPDGTVGVRLDSPLRDGPLAAIWSRFQDNVNAFGAHKMRPQPSFGRKKD